MKVYKVYFVDEEADETRQEMFEGIQVVSEDMLRTVCKECVEEETILPHTFEAWKSDYDIDKLDFMTAPIGQLIDLLEYDGYSVQEVDLV